jgi:hypothetical protein
MKLRSSCKSISGNILGLFGYLGSTFLLSWTLAHFLNEGSTPILNAFFFSRNIGLAIYVLILLIFIIGIFSRIKIRSLLSMLILLCSILFYEYIPLYRLFPYRDDLKFIATCCCLTTMWRIENRRWLCGLFVFLVCVILNVFAIHNYFDFHQHHDFFRVGGILD